MPLDFDMSDRKCSLIGAKCPGTWINAKSWGCPYWREMWVDTEAEQKPVHWVGCGILMDTELTLGITKAVNSAAASIQGVRNVTARGFIGLALAAQIDPAPIMAQIAKADQDTNGKKDSLALKNGDEIDQLKSDYPKS